ncbi:hypothetical protein G4B88_020307 [Cannabis sativa]|uniref:Uncharacterized protein n=1 Tax=Cannabis sativa TaxID=3483 RepID=A0A7J6EP62_CANSA|nr:hypothetical protein G4B88_020307 [Cannabis sativa]
MVWCGNALKMLKVSRSSMDFIYLKIFDESIVPPIMGYKDYFRVPTRFAFRKNPLDLSNSIPLEEVGFRGSSSNQGLQDVVNRFYLAIIMTAMSISNVSYVAFCVLALLGIYIVLSSTPDMASTVVTNVDKGKSVVGSVNLESTLTSSDKGKRVVYSPIILPSGVSGPRLSPFLGGATFTLAFTIEGIKSIITLFARVRDCWFREPLRAVMLVRLTARGTTDGLTAEGMADELTVRGMTDEVYYEPIF